MIPQHLFSWLQGSDFYRQLHQEAVNSLPPGAEHDSWIDVGCGPGLVARLAAERGYRALGIDLDRGMIRMARQIAARQHSTARFTVGTAAALRDAAAVVVSAASLLAVLAHPLEGLMDLWRGVRPGGSLLVIEPTAAMTPANARAYLRNGLGGRSAAGLYLWALARQGRAVDSSICDHLGAARRRHIPLLDGMAAAWILQRESTTHR